MRVVWCVCLKRRVVVVVLGVDLERSIEWE